jgi:hypothetical protein
MSLIGVFEPTDAVLVEASGGNRFLDLCPECRLPKQWPSGSKRYMGDLGFIASYLA